MLCKAFVIIFATAFVVFVVAVACHKMQAMCGAETQFSSSCVRGRFGHFVRQIAALAARALGYKAETEVQRET